METLAVHSTFVPDWSCKRQQVAVMDQSAELYKYIKLINMSKALKVLGTEDPGPNSSINPDASGDSLTLVKKRHEKFLLRFLDILPGDRFSSAETSRMTIIFFAISGLDVLGCLEQSIKEDRKKEIIDWIYSLQVETGFLGSTFLKTSQLEQLCDSVHIAMTYTALATLVILGTNLHNFLHGF